MLSSLKNELLAHRRYLHQNPEIGFEMPGTKAYIEQALLHYGLTPLSCGKSGVCATIGRGKTCVLLRADMDALPLTEQTGHPFASRNEKYMHACGHDLHTAMLLGAAKILKEKEAKLNGIVKLMFQPAEETLLGAKDMIKAGILKNPVPIAAFMVHVSAGLPIKTGTAVISAPGTVAPSSDHFNIILKGKGCHGAMPQNGHDSILAAAHLLIALQTLQTREFADRKILLTFGMFKAGTNSNILPETTLLSGTLRTFDETTRNQVKKRIHALSQQLSAAFSCIAKIDYFAQCPVFHCDKRLFEFAMHHLKNTLSSDVLPKSTGSEDFAYISQKIPTVLAYLPAGDSRKGYKAPLHSPKVIFDENVLLFGAETYADFAFNFLNKNLP